MNDHELAIGARVREPGTDMESHRLEAETDRIAAALHPPGDRDSDAARKAARVLVRASVPLLPSDYGSLDLDPSSAAGSSVNTSIATSRLVSMPLTNATVRRPSASSTILRN